MEFLDLIKNALVGLTNCKPQVWAEFDLENKTLPESEAICYPGFCGTKISHDGIEIIINANAELQIEKNGGYSLAFDQDIKQHWFILNLPNGERFNGDTSEDILALIDAIPALNAVLYQERLNFKVLEFVQTNRDSIEWSDKPENLTIQDALALMKVAEIFPEISLDSIYEVTNGDDEPEGAVNFWCDGYLNVKLPYGFEFYSSCYVDFCLTPENVLTASIDSSSLDYFGECSFVDAIFESGQDAKDMRIRFDPETDETNMAETFKTLFIDGFISSMTDELLKEKNILTMQTLKECKAWKSE